MEASVRTRVVSWNDAAEMKLSVDSDALVIPSSTGCAVAAGLPPLLDRAFVLFLEAELVHLFVHQELRVADLLDAAPRIIWRTIISMCLSLMFTPCSR